MLTPRRRRLLTLDVLEDRLAMSTVQGHHIEAAVPKESKAATAAVTIPPGDTLTVLNGFVKSYRTVVGDPRYNPAYDVNHNGQIGQTDGRILLRSLPPLGPKIPLGLKVIIAPQDQVKGHVPTNLGGATYVRDVTILGRTTPGSLIFTGTGTLDLKLRGPAYVADANGNFSLKLEMSDGINQFDLQVVDPYGQQTLRAFPIRWMGFARYESLHPART